MGITLIRPLVFIIFLTLLFSVSVVEISKFRGVAQMENSFTAASKKKEPGVDYLSIPLLTLVVPPILYLSLKIK